MISDTKPMIGRVQDTKPVVEVSSSKPITSVEDVKSSIGVVNVKSNMGAISDKTVVYTEIRNIEVGQPMGLLLAITYPVEMAGTFSATRP